MTGNHSDPVFVAEATRLHNYITRLRSDAERARRDGFDHLAKAMDRVALGLTDNLVKLVAENRKGK